MRSNEAARRDFHGDEEIKEGAGEAPAGSATEFPSEMIFEFQESYTDEQRQNLYQKILKMTTPERMRLAVLGNREARNLLIRDPMKMIALSVLRNPKVHEQEIEKYAHMKNISEDVILAIAKHQKWIKSYAIKLAVVSNPKTPLTTAINLLSHLYEKDLKLLERNKNVSPVVSRTAHQVRLKRKV
jgi:hypothetical protein